MAPGSETAVAGVVPRRAEQVPLRPSLLDGLDAGETDGDDGGHGQPARALRRRGLRNLVLFALSAAAVIVVWQVVRRPGPDLAAASRMRTLIDSESGEVFADHRVAEGASYPLVNPKTGRATLFPAERCYWTRAGEAKWRPTFVFVPPGEASAVCPECGREVVPHNPRPPEDLMLEALRRHREGG